MPTQELSGTTALVTGASRSFGRAIAVALSKHGPHVAGQLLDKHRPRTLVLNAGAAPLPRPIHRQTRQTFSRNWEVDVQHVFNWTREALLLPLQPGSVVIAISSGAAINCSPLSGGYAGAKATIRFIASYAADESAGTGSASGSPPCCRSSLRRQDWARPESQWAG
jgi:NAD(P)-dependent dehydrogenase (short-subunit alcohol dehydrogenase family)